MDWEVWEKERQKGNMVICNSQVQKSSWSKYFCPFLNLKPKVPGTYLFSECLNKRMGGVCMRTEERMWEGTWEWISLILFSFFEESVRVVIMCDGRERQRGSWKIEKWVTRNLKHVSSQWWPRKRSGLQTGKWQEKDFRNHTDVTVEVFWIHCLGYG